MTASNQTYPHGTPTRLAQLADRPPRRDPSASTIEKAYVRGLKEGMRRGDAKRQELLAKKNELAVRYKLVVGENRRLRSKKCNCGDLHAANCPLYVNPYGGGHAC